MSSTVPSLSGRPSFFLFRARHRIAAIAFSGLLGAVACGSPPELTTDDDAGDAADGSSDSSGDGAIGDDDDAGSGGNPDPGGGPGVCGNGKLEMGELCDDGNEADADGCSGNCLVQDPEYDCSTPGEPCVDTVVCNNGTLEGEEACDEGTALHTAGCANECATIAPGWTCPRPGQSCVPLPVCGNGLRERGEQCDDGQATPANGDGCNASCQQESGYFCRTGQPCIELTCGDGTRTPDEACDDGNDGNGDGCSAACLVEEGFRCSTAGCTSVCGDSKIRGEETCDDGNRNGGDGCSSVCRKEPYYDCPVVGELCVSNISCGNGVLEPGEVCDPGLSGSTTCDSTGSDACKRFDSEFVDPPVCGNGTLEYQEACDGDGGFGGCTSACALEDGYVCPKANYCYLVPACGDGLLQPGEECDVGMMSAAACDACQVQPNYYCSGSAPSTCVASLCGDSLVAPNEQCDDGNATSNDGCDACTVETGWVCPPGIPCQPVCGDNVRKGSEQCDPPGVGCSASCRTAAGYDCSSGSCVLTVCGNGNAANPVGAAQAGEGCDDGNLIAGDGCGPTCQKEPTFNSSGTASLSCGDGIITLGEACDDGNATAGDGCSATCAVESGYSCTNNSLTYPAYVDFKVTYRDFKSSTTAGGHPDFQRDSTTESNIPGPPCKTGFAQCTAAGGVACPANTCGYLDANRVPDFHRTNGTGNITDKDTFKLWYFGTNSSGAVKDKFGTTAVVVDSIQSSLRLTQQSGQPGVYRFSSGTHYPLGNTAAGVAEQGSGFSCAQNTGDSCCNSGGTCVGRNYHFTTQLRYFFQYKGGETLTFAGDDDVWVFINGRHAVDIGGIHGPQYGRVILGDDGDGNGTDSNCSVHNGGSLPSCSLQSGESTAANLADDKRFGLVKDGVYEIVLFHAERRTSGSNFDLTLAGFLAPRSTCSTTCGDGIVAGNELCDQGSSNRNGVYGVCNTSCGFTFCGDNTTTAPETCDNGRNIDTYVAGSLSGKCAPGCMTPGRCGDGIRQSSSEVCDDGVNDGSYGGCAAGCQALAGYCGDGVQNGAEDCDAGVNTTSYRADGTGCGFDCKPAPYCGDQERNGPEQCDPSVPGQQNCNSNCEFAPFCGDGVRGGNEECDYGIFGFDGPASEAPYGTCTTACKAGPSCGDGVRQLAEECDDGNDPLTGNVDGAYNRCTTSCTFGPRCGDGVVSSSQSEACDNGYNEDTYAYVSDACGPSCQAVPYCGDAVLQSDFELCDNGSTGPNRNASDAYNGCTPSCDWGPYCGDGIKNGPETCDQGGANTAYQSAKGACGYDCDWASYCGDGVKDGPEQCDLGSDNTGTYGGCKADCTFAARCGDRKVDPGEACDAGPTGSLSCTPRCSARSDVR